MTKAQLMNTTAARSNVSTYGDDILSAAGKNAEKQTVSVQLAHTHGERFEKLLPLIRTPDANVRGILIDDWSSTPAAGDWIKSYDRMQSIKDKTPTQQAAFAVLQGIKANLNTTLSRAVDTYEGMQILRSLGRTVTVRRMKGVGELNIFQCTVLYVNEALPEDDREHAPVPLTAAELMRVKAVHLAKKIDDDTDSDTLKTLLSPSAGAAAPTGKKGAANAEKGANGDAIDASKMTTAIASLDTAISTHLRSDGHSIAGSKDANLAMHLLWAKLDSIMTDAQKAKARKVYAAEADERATKEAAAAEAAKAAAAEVKANADKAAADATARAAKAKGKAA